ncbi:MAG: PTS sugar transporter subunit IIA [Planctomycetota bacterium]
MSKTPDGPPFHKLFATKTISISAKATTQTEVLQLLTDLAVKGGGLAEDRRAAVLKALIAREEIGSTGIGVGIAIPHVKTDDVSETVAALCVTQTPVDFRAVDGEPCDLFILMLSPKDQAEKHLEVLRWLSKLVRNTDFCRFLRASNTSREAVSLFKEMSE